MRTGLIYLWLIAGAVIAGSACWLILSHYHPFIPMDKELAMLDQPTQDQIGEKIAHNRANDALALAVFGSCSLAAGTPLLARGLKWWTTIIAFVAAAALGGMVGWAMAKIGFYCEDWLPVSWDKLVRVAVRWMVMLTPLGLSAGLLATAFSRQWNQTGSLITGGIIGGILAGLLYCLVVAFFFQTENADAVLPPSSNARIVLFGLTPFLMWASIARQSSSAWAHRTESVSAPAEAA